jgi:hypothetical protein
MGVASFVCFKISESDLIYLMNLTNRENVYGNEYAKYVSSGSIRLKSNVKES